MSEELIAEIRRQADESARLTQRLMRDAEGRRIGRRIALWGDGTTNAEKMVRLCDLFPTLRGVPGTDPWDATTLVDWLTTSGEPTGGSTHAAMFVLGVWNGQTDWQSVADDMGPVPCVVCDGIGRVDANGDGTRGGPLPCRDCASTGKVARALAWRRFNLFAALGTWDDEHRTAFLTWCEAPFSP